MQFEVGDFVAITRGEPYEELPARNPFVYMMDAEPRETDSDPIIRYDDFHQGKIYEVMSVAPSLAAIKCVAVSNSRDLTQIDTVISIQTNLVEAMVVGPQYHLPMREWNDKLKAEIEKDKKEYQNNPQQQQPVQTTFNGVPIVFDVNNGQ